MIRSSAISSYFLSGAIHVSVVGLAYVSYVGGYVPPGYGMRSGGTSGAGGTIWSPQLESPFDVGEVVELKGDDGQELGLSVTIIDSSAAQVLEAEPLLEVTVSSPEAGLSHPAAEPLPTGAAFVSLAPAVRLPEPTFSLREPIESRKSEAAPALTTQEPLASEPVSTPQNGTDIKPKDPSASTASESANTGKSGRSRRSVDPPPETEDLPERTASASVAARKGDSERGQIAGNSDGQALQATSSAASQPSPGSGLPPGARPDQRPSNLPANPAPPYPADAYQLRQQGVVHLEVTVAVDGTARSVKVRRSSGFTLLDEAALKTVAHWKFQPATYLGRPVQDRVVVPINFEIDAVQ